jgi:hypothetical protein
MNALIQESASNFLDADDEEFSVRQIPNGAIAEKVAALGAQYLTARTLVDNGLRVSSAESANAASMSPTIMSSPQPVPQRDPVPSSFNALAEWEGIVNSVGKDTFSASLVQLPRGSELDRRDQANMGFGPTEETELPIEDIPPFDRDLLRPGALFRLVIGYDIKRSGQRIRALSVVFRRLPKWQRSEIAEAARLADEEQDAFSLKTTGPLGDG